MIHVFHGFLGSPKDFDFLPKRKEFIFHDLYRMNFDQVEISPTDTLIGYSMGGRVAMELASKAQFQLKKLVIINSHPGLGPEEKKERMIWEDEVLNRLRMNSPEEFLNYWNNLPLFKFDEPLKDLSLEKLRSSAILFEKLRLSGQKNYVQELEKFKDKILWISSPQDEKYYQVAKKLIMPLGIKCCFLQGGHRLFQRHVGLLSILKEEGII
ncbi:MAG: hypothetical protein AB7I27_01230 [Bacteriovoracaceae bacterium]